jgi:signal transduction histidine kinase
MLLFSLLTLPWLAAVPDLNLITPYLNLLFFGVLIVLSVAMLLASWRSNSWEGLLVSGWNLLNIPVAVHDLLLQNYLIPIEGIYLLPYTVLGTFALFMLILLRRYVTAIRDVEQANERLEARLRERERELHESHEQLRRIEHQQMLARERQRLMRDMHDGMGSALVSTLVAVERGALSPDETAALLRDCIDELRLTIDSLEPADADLVPLLGNLRYRMEPRLRQAGVELCWRVESLPALQWLDTESTLHVLRILQEVFANLLKHSACTRISVHTEHDAEGVTVVISDNGRAFAGEAEGRPGKGLTNLRQRAALVEARLTWEAGAGQNVFRVWLPHSRPCRNASA